MQIRHVVALTIAFAATSAACAQTNQTQYSYLHQATNELFRTRSSSAQPTPAEIAKMASIGCSALGQLLKDETLPAEIKKLAAGAGAHSRYHTTLNGDLRQFVDFLAVEAKQLKDAKVSDEAATQILSSISFLKDSLGKTPDPAKLLADIGTLRSELCAAAATMHKEGEDAKAQAQRQEKLKNWSMGLGGLTTILVDIPLFAPSAGVATASFTVGGALFTVAITK